MWVCTLVQWKGEQNKKTINIVISFLFYEDEHFRGLPQTGLQQQAENNIVHSYTEKKRKNRRTIIGVL